MIAHAYKAEFVNETLTTTAIEALVNNCKIDQGKNVSTFCFSSSDTKLSHWIPFQRKDWICFERENPLKISGLFCKKNGNFARLTVISQSILQFDQWMRCFKKEKISGLILLKEPIYETLVRNQFDNLTDQWMRRLNTETICEFFSQSIW